MIMQRDIAVSKKVLIVTATSIARFFRSRNFWIQRCITPLESSRLPIASTTESTEEKSEYSPYSEVERSLVKIGVNINAAAFEMRLAEVKKIDAPAG